MVQVELFYNLQTRSRVMTEHRRITQQAQRVATLMRHYLVQILIKVTRFFAYFFLFFFIYS